MASKAASKEASKEASKATSKEALKEAFKEPLLRHLRPSKMTMTLYCEQWTFVTFCN